jgi:uncharacterized membrane protein YfcA
LDFAAIGLSDVGAAQLGVVALIAFLGGVLGGVSAFGTGLLITPFVVPVFGVDAVVPIMAVAMTLGNIGRVWANWRALDLRVVGWILIPALPSVVLGTKIYELLPSYLLSLVIGGFLLISVPLRRFLTSREIRPERQAIVPVAAGFGLVSGTVPGGGILILPVLLGVGLQGGAIVGTDALIGATVNLVKIVMFGQYDLLDLRRFIAGLIIGVCVIPGAFVARQIVERMGVRVHTAVVEVMVIFAGLSLIWSGMQQ